MLCRQFLSMAASLLLLAEGSTGFSLSSDRASSTSTSTSNKATSSNPVPEGDATRRALFQATVASSLSILGAPLVANAAYIDPAIDPPTITKRVYLDVRISGKETGRLVIGLYGDAVPRVCQNFEELCRSNAYAGTTFYRVLADFSIQGGAIDDPTGKTGKSASGKPFEPDNFNIKHTQRGLVSMVRGIGGSVDSRFFINCVDDSGWADDRYSAFGIVEEGFDLVKKIEKVDVQPPKNSPRSEVSILASGVIE